LPRKKWQELRRGHSKGWICARELKAGDGLSCHDGQWVTVEAVTDLKEVATVYNLRVSDYHTYFVGSREWGFSVWAHNSCFEIVEEAGRFRIRSTTTGTVTRGSYATRAEAEAWIARFSQQELRLADYRRLVERGELSPLGLHDIYAQRVRPGATPHQFPGPGSEGGRLGSRIVDDFDRATGTAYEFCTQQWATSPESEIVRKLSELAGDAALLADRTSGVRRVQWYGLENLPTTGRAARIRTAFDEYRRQGLNIEYIPLVPAGW
jgi:hypothetical protein